MEINENQKKGFLARLLGHLCTVHEHRSLVRRNCFACGLYWQGLTHDLSKYSPSEFWPSVRYYQGYRSPYTLQKEMQGYAPGWLHHKGRNRHHWEYWYDTLDGHWQPIRMPDRFLAEMVCDRVAASRTYLRERYTSSSPLQYFESRAESGYMNPATRDSLHHILAMISDQGEQETFRWIRMRLKHSQPL